jgi:hypothetical protein
MATATRSKKKIVHRVGPLQLAKELGWEREEDFAATLVAWLRANKWEVYQEVEPPNCGSCADIVAVQGAVVWIIECKLCFSAEVLWQATQWLPYGNYVSVAVPTQGRGRERVKLFDRYCRQNGIGVLLAKNHYYGFGDGKKESKEQYEFDEEVKPEFRRWPTMRDKFKDFFTERHKTFAKAGNAKGLRFTPWRATCEAVSEKVKETPGISMKECIDQIKHHYSSNSCARNSMAKWIEAGKVEGVRSERDGRLLRLYPVEMKK